MEKKAFRKKILDRRREIFCADTDAKVINNFLQSDVYKKSSQIMAYVSFDTEINTHTLIKQALEDGKHIIVPICNKENRTMILSEIKDFPDDLEAGNYGILEVRQDRLRVVDPSIIDLVIVPGCAFTEKGHRLGFGGGYYDRFLETINDDCPTVALVRNDFIFDQIPMDPHDKSVNYTVTESSFNCCCPLEES